jgi:hypothetical protein
VTKFTLQHSKPSNQFKGPKLRSDQKPVAAMANARFTTAAAAQLIEETWSVERLIHELAPF